jgi:hypothetical protein
MSMSLSLSLSLSLPLPLPLPLPLSLPPPHPLQHREWQARRANLWSWLHPTRFFSSSFLQQVADFPCAFSQNPPECVARFAYGLSPSDPESDDEL